MRGAREHNLRDVDLRVPLGTFVAVTGVSGSGKSTLVTEVLYRALARELNGSREPVGAHDSLEGAEHIDKIIEIDQSPIGRTPRSNPATYVGLFTPIRELFAGVPESRLRGYTPGRFSFNVKGGRCEHCKGDGILKIEMQFLPDVYVPCEVCHGKRYNREALEIHYKGKSIADVLEMTIAEALEFFSAVPNIRAKLQTLNDVGLGYVHLGQPATTLSGGEAQRVKLSTELSRRATGRTFYVLDEPTTVSISPTSRSCSRSSTGWSRMELIDARAAALTAEHLGVASPVDGAWLLLIELAGDTDHTERLAEALDGATAGR